MLSSLKSGIAFPQGVNLVARTSRLVDAVVLEELDCLRQEGWPALVTRLRFHVQSLHRLPELLHGVTLPISAYRQLLDLMT